MHYSRRAFTMIELVFVMVILGILAAVALPKFVSMRDQSEYAIIVGFTGTMNRTVGPMLWSTSIDNGFNGSISTDANTEEFNGHPLTHYTNNYPNFLDITTVDFSNCISGSGVANPFIRKTAEGELNLFCQDGDDSNTPTFVANENSTYSF